MKDKILEYISGYYSKKKKAPSIARILRHFKKGKMNKTRFYKFFPAGISEACRLAGVPAPKKRVEKMKNVKSSKKSKKKDSASDSALGILLTETQSRRLYGIMQLEGGTDPNVIISRLLDEDTLARKHKLTLKQRRMVSKFLEASVKRGWETGGNPNILDCITKLHNVGFNTVSPLTLKFLIGVLEKARQKGWTTADFVNYATKHYNELQLYGRYEKGEIGYDEFEREMRNYA